MNFTSPVFLLFLGIVLVGVRFLPSKYRYLLLLPASWFFYAWHSLPLLFLLLLATLISYGCGLWMGNTAQPSRRRLALLLGSLSLLGMLFIFKYLDLAADGWFALLSLFGQERHFDGFHLLLPMGISFYVFQTLSYLIDVYRGTRPPEKHFGYYALFVSFFPQLVAGPIERPGDLLPQLRQPMDPTLEMKGEGLRFLLLGYGKKVMIADLLSPLVDRAYADPSGAGGGALAIATILFALQIYCDFSGYSDIARGCANLAGIRLSSNFEHPYRAVTIRDFWRRWHISLTKWFTDYVYIPLGGSRRGIPRQCMATLVVFLLSGLWHGANLTFVIWGLLHGCYLVLEILFDGHKEPRFPLLRRIVTLTAVWFAWIFFRSSDVHTALQVLQLLPSGWHLTQILQGLGIGASDALLMLGVIFTLPLLDRLPVLTKKQTVKGDLLLYFLLILTILLCRFLALSQGNPGAFIYFQF